MRLKHREVEYHHSGFSWMKLIFVLALVLYGASQINAEKTLTWGKITDDDVVMFYYVYKLPALGKELNHNITFTVPAEGAPQRHDITFVSLENRNEENADMKITDGGIGKRFVTVTVLYPKGAPADVVFTIRGTHV